MSDSKPNIKAAMTSQGIGQSGYAPAIHMFRDGVANTLIFAEAAPQEAVPWTQPIDLWYAPEKPLPPLGRADEAFIIVCFADFGVFKLPKDLPEEAWRGLITRNGKDEASRDKLGVLPENTPAKHVPR